MKAQLFHRIRRLLGRSGQTAGFTLVEVIVSAAAFTIICAGLTVLLITALRIEKYTAENTNCRETVRMVKAYVKEQAAKGAITQAASGDALELDGTEIIACEADPDRPGEYRLMAGGVKVAGGLESSVGFTVDADRLVRFTVSMAEESFPIAIYCPEN